MELMLFLLGSTMGCGVCGWWFGGLVAHDLGQQLRPPADFLPTEPPLAGSTVRRAERSPFVLPPPERSTPPAL